MKKRIIIKFSYLFLLVIPIVPMEQFILTKQEKKDSVVSKDLGKGSATELFKKINLNLNDYIKQNNDGRITKTEILKNFLQFQNFLNKELNSAICHNNGELVKSYLAIGADTNEQINDEELPLCQAIENGCDIELIQSLLVAGADPNRGISRLPLFSAICYKGPDRLKLFMMLRNFNTSLFVNMKIDSNIFHYLAIDPDIPLQNFIFEVASKELMPEKLKLLLNSVNKNGCQPIHHLMNHDEISNVELLYCLLKNDCEVNRSHCDDIEHRTPLFLAVANKIDIRYIKLLILCGRCKYLIGKSTGNAAIDLAKKTKWREAESILEDPEVYRSMARSDEDILSIVEPEVLDKWLENKK